LLQHGLCSAKVSPVSRLQEGSGCEQDNRQGKEALEAGKYPPENGVEQLHTNMIGVGTDYI
jgi:hypothetical protein